MAPRNKQDWEERFAEFWEGMRARMLVSGHKYGDVRAAYPHKRDAIKSMEQRLKLYLETHNIEALLDAANFLLIEAMCPRFPDAHMRSTDSNESPGCAKVSGGQDHGAASISQVARIRSGPEFKDWS